MPIPKPTRTPLQIHTEQWKGCTKCEYSKRRTKVVIGKGKSPCDILFIGEAPGDAEDTSGVPFDAQAGRLLAEIVLQSGACNYDRAYTNIVGCIPLAYDEKLGRFDKEDPSYDCVMACKPRVEEFIKITQPKLIITVGKQATEYLEQTWRDAIQAPGIKQEGISHPSAILRAPYIQRDMMVMKCVATIRRAIREIFTS